MDEKNFIVIEEKQSHHRGTKISTTSLSYNRSRISEGNTHDKTTPHVALLNDLGKKKSLKTVGRLSCKFWEQKLSIVNIQTSMCMIKTILN